jgi:hypothetical protein
MDRKFVIAITFVVAIGLVGCKRPSTDVATAKPDTVKPSATAPSTETAAPKPPPASIPKPLFSQAIDPKSDARTFSLGPYGTVEFGYTMEKDATLIYSWKSTTPLSFDFHTEPAGKPPDSSDSFEMGKASDSRGGYVAPYAGIHGWYWENMTDKEVTLTLATTGFFSKAMLYDEDGNAHEVPLTQPRPARGRR